MKFGAFYIQPKYIRFRQNLLFQQTVYMMTNLKAVQNLTNELRQDMSKLACKLGELFVLWR